MAKPKKLLKIILGILIGLFCSQLFANTNICRPHFRPSKSTPLTDPDTDALTAEEESSLYFSSKSKNLLFAGVMTAEQYLDTRAKAVYDTWGKEVPGKILFFSSETSRSKKIPLVALSGVDDSYPPQKKSFTMLKYMHDHFVDQYEWFLRADDDVYIRSDKLEKLLRSVDSRKPLFIGQTGKGTKEEIGQLSLDSDENFCMGGPGIIMSRETLKRIAPYIEECLQNLYTTHEDVEVGRCVRKYAGISCTWSYEMQVIFYHNHSGEAAYSGDLKQKEVHRAITLHPVKQSEYMYRLHTYIHGLKVQNTIQKNILLHRDIASSMKELGYRISSLENATLAEGLPLYPIKRGSKGYLGDTSLLGIPVSISKYQPRTLQDVLEWELISKTLYSHRDFNPRKRIGSSLKEGLSDVIREIMELINSFSKQRGRVIDFREILYGYWRLDPVHGVDLILDLLLVYRKYRGHKMTVQVRRHAYVQQTFSGIYIREATNKTELHLTQPQPQQTSKNIVHQIISKISNNLPPLLSFARNKTKTVINLLLPLSGRFGTFSRFLKMYGDLCVNEWEATKLYVILYRSSETPEDYYRTLRLIQRLNSRVKHSDSAVVVIEEGNQTFSRAFALQKAVNCLENSDLMLFIDVDIVFDGKFLDRIRKNTLPGKTVYFPILYSLYSPRPLSKDTYITKDYSYFTENLVTNSYSGFWRQFGFGIVSLYKKDYQILGGFNLEITGWGAEDVTFFDNVVKSHLKIVRCVDPGLIHVFHEVKCDSGDMDLVQTNMCLGTKGSTLGSMQTLQRIFEQYRKLFR